MDGKSVNAPLLPKKEEYFINIYLCCCCFSIMQMAIEKY
jgi:hypothetical protein